MKSINIIWRTFLVLAILSLSSCSSDPDSSLGDETFKGIVNEQSQSKISVENFVKTNGIKREVAGQPIYTLEYNTTVVFNEGGWKWRDIGTGYFNDFKLRDNKPSGWDAYGKNWKYFSQGDEFELTGDITYEKTEKGWRMTEYKVKTYKITFDSKRMSKFLGKWSGNGISIEFTKVGKENELIIIYDNNEKINATASINEYMQKVNIDMLILNEDLLYEGKSLSNINFEVEGNLLKLSQGKDDGFYRIVGELSKAY